MKTYLILQHPGHNRVYYNLSGPLALAELKVASSRLNSTSSAIEIVNIEGIRYLSLTTEDELTTLDLELLSRLSFVFALFELETIEDKRFLKPLLKKDYEYVDSKISSLLKYAGKTNELFTKMMVNVGLLSSDFSFEDNIQLLDPVAGKGTTLYEGSIYGFNVTGIEIDPKSTQAIQLFFKKYLETERYKYGVEKKQVFGKNKGEATYADCFEYAQNKADFKSDEHRKSLNIITGSTLNASDYSKANYFNLIIGDLPYGVAHGNSLDKKATSITRNPAELLEASLPGWFKVLKKGGVVVIAWNAFVVSRKRLSDIFIQHGFQVLTESPYDEFEHMVDRSIKRDIVVAKKI
jgi:hypothetical protein